VAWGRVPVVGNVRLDVLSERMAGTEPSSTPGGEKLVVRWKTGRSAANGSNGGGSMTDMSRKMLSVLGTEQVPDPRNPTAHQDGDFHGLFIFEFDEEGRISRHTIEHVEQCNVWDRTAKVISVTDWLLGKGWRKEGQAAIPELAFWCNDFQGGEEKKEQEKK
jgi:hypothetical protein